MYVRICKHGLYCTFTTTGEKKEQQKYKIRNLSKNVRPLSRIYIDNTATSIINRYYQ